MTRPSGMNQGFTLIELSIVLVIIGLIVGSILAGQSLIRGSQVNSAMLDAQRYISATQAFVQKYNALPGDFANATTYWGSMSSCPPTEGSTTQSGTQTCPGSGNGTIVDLSTSPVGSANTYTNTYESFLYWQHLALAQLIPGSYSGISGAGGSHTYDHVLGTNAPLSRVDNGGFGMTYVGTVASTQGNTNYFSPASSSMNYGHVLIFGGYSSNNLPVAATLTAAEAQGIDNKYDDGKPGSGTILTWENTGYNANCATSATASSAQYYVSKTGPQCSLIIITGF